MIMQKKVAVSAADLCMGLPSEFTEYMLYVKSLEFGQPPEYKKLRLLFQGLAERNDIQYDNIFDWTEELFLREKENMNARR